LGRVLGGFWKGFVRVWSAFFEVIVDGPLATLPSIMARRNARSD
jgi:hypothetical protein